MTPIAHAMARQAGLLEDRVIIDLPVSLPPTLGVGAFMKATVARIDGNLAIVDGDGENLDEPAALRRHGLRIDAVIAEGNPSLIGHDLHPDFISTRIADDCGVPGLGVQHHHAHLAAVAAEHGLMDPFIGLALDGFGMGTDGGSWGGELMAVERSAMRRLGYLNPLPLPGGDAAARAPWRMAAAALFDLGRAGEIDQRFAGQPGADLLAAVMQSKTCRRTSSAGRLFDAACGLLGLRLQADFEGQAPMELEALADAPRVLDRGWRITEDNRLDLRPLLQALSDMQPGPGANLFHGTLAAALADWVIAAAKKNGVNTVALSGGCFLNKVLKGILSGRLQDAGLHVYGNRLLSPGDSCVSLGQAWVAAWSLKGHESIDREGPTPCA